MRFIGLIYFVVLICSIIMVGCTREKCIDCKIGTKSESYCEPDQATLDMQKDAIEAKGGTCKQN